MIARRGVALVIALLALACAAAPGSAMPGDAYPLSLAVVSGGGPPELLLAQRVIERQWGPSEDSLYVEVDVPEWRSEGMAAALSAAVPGAGELYAGDRRGIWFALAEVVGLTTHLVMRDRGHKLQDEAAHIAGAPADSSSGWSFRRWSRATGQDSSSMVALYAADRQAFYDLIANDERYVAGWNGLSAQSSFADFRRHGDDRLRMGRYAAMGMWVNHVVSAVDALRLAHLHNLPLRRNLDLRVRAGWRRGSPEGMAVLVRRF